MVKRFHKYLEKLKKTAGICKKSVKNEVKEWKAVSFNILIKVLLFLLSKTHPGASVDGHTPHSIPNSDSILNLIRVLLILSFFVSLFFIFSLKSRL